MFGAPSHVRQLALRKQLLIAESELNRAQLLEDWRAASLAVRDVAGHVQTTAAWALSAALLVAGLVGLRHRTTTAADDKPSWFKRALEGARWVYSIWLGPEEGVGMTVDSYDESPMKLKNNRHPEGPVRV